MSNRRMVALAAAAITGALSVSGQAAEKSISVGVDYSTGEYGGEESTDIWFVPVSAKYQTQDWILKLTIPYIRITGPADVIPDVGRVARPPEGRRTEQGLGDILLSVTRTAYASREVLVDVTGKVKFATADEDKGLGTGENDYYLQVDTYVPVGDTTAFGTVGYKALGDPARFDLNDVWYATLGFSHPVNDTTSAGAIADWREASSATGDPRRELTVFATHDLTSLWSLQGYAVKGFSDGSPDWALGAVVIRAFD